MHQNNACELHLPTTDVTIFFNRLKVTKYSSCLTDLDTLLLHKGGGIMVGKRIGGGVGLHGLNIVRFLVHAEQSADLPLANLEKCFNERSDTFYVDAARKLEEGVMEVIDEYQ